MKKNSIILGLVFVLVFIFGLFGPKLAKEGKGVQGEELVGAFFTTQGWEDIFPSEITGGGSIEEDYRIFASLTKEEGEVKYSFPKLEGQWVIQERQGDTETILSSPASYLYIQTKEEENGTEDKITNSLFLLAGERRIYFSYPIYKNKDGQFFVRISGNGISVEGEGEESFSVSNSETHSTSGPQESNQRSLSVENKVEFLDPIQWRKIFEFSKDNILIREENFDKSMEKAYKADPRTEYIIVEEGSQKNSKRKIYSKGQESMEIFFQEGIYFQRKDIKIIWP